MNPSTFWLTRYLVMSISLVIALTCTIIILWKRLHSRLLMLYILLLSLSESLMALSGFFFTDNFIDVKSPDELNHQSPWMELSQVQGYCYQTFKLVTLALTASITYTVYLTVHQKYDTLRKVSKCILIGSFLGPMCVMAPTLFYIGNGPCAQGEIYYNCSCSNSSYSYAVFLVNWMLPCSILGVITFWLMWKIYKFKVPNQHSTTVKLAQLVYKILPWNFILFLVNYSMKFFPDSDSAVQAAIISDLNSVIFAMPIVSLTFIGVYLRRKYSIQKSRKHHSLLTQSDKQNEEKHDLTK